MDDVTAPSPDGPPLVRLGTFAPPLARRIVALLRHRGIVHAADPPPPAGVPTDVESTDELDAVDVTITVPAEWRDDLAAELFTNWAELLRGLAPEEVALVGPAGGSHPGWRDAPADAWIDEYGRLQVDVEREEVRAVGPALVVGGLALTLLGVFADTISTGFGVTFGLLAIVVGALLPH